MAKVLFLPLNYGMVIQDGIEDAFREAGQNLKTFDYYTFYDQNKQNRELTNKEFLKIVDEFKPDLIFAQIQHTTIINAESFGIIKNKYPNIIICNYTVDIRNIVPQTYANIACYANYNFITSIGQIDMFERTLNKKMYFLQIGYNPKLYYSQSIQPTSFEYDCAFIATNNAKEGYPGVSEREKVARILRREFGHRFALFGLGWPPDVGSKGVTDQRKLINIYHKSLCCISVSHYNDLSHYFSDRLLMCMASGRPTISYRFPNWESYFSDRSDLLIANSIEEFPKLVKQLKADQNYANFIGEMGATKVKAEHTYLSRIIEMLNIIGVK